MVRMARSAATPAKSAQSPPRLLIGCRAEPAPLERGRHRSRVPQGRKHPLARSTPARSAQRCRANEGEPSDKCGGRGADPPRRGGHEARGGSNERRGAREATARPLAPPMLPVMFIPCLCSTFRSANAAWNAQSCLSLLANGAPDKDALSYARTSGCLSSTRGAPYIKVLGRRDTSVHAPRTRAPVTKRILSCGPLIGSTGELRKMPRQRQARQKRTWAPGDAKGRSTTSATFLDVVLLSRCEAAASVRAPRCLMDTVKGHELDDWKSAMVMTDAPESMTAALAAAGAIGDTCGHTTEPESRLREEDKATSPRSGDASAIAATKRVGQSAARWMQRFARRCYLGAPGAVPDCSGPPASTMTAAWMGGLAPWRPSARKTATEAHRAWHQALASGSRLCCCTRTTLDACARALHNTNHARWLRRPVVGGRRPASVGWNDQDTHDRQATLRVERTERAKDTANITTTSSARGQQIMQARSAV